MKIATWNVNSITVRLPQVIEWLEYAQPDILALQETKIPDEKFPHAAIKALGYHVCFSGQKTYNGVAIISKDPATKLETDVAAHEDPQRRILAATIKGVRIVNVYVPNGAEVGSEKYAYKLDWLRKLKIYLQQQLEEYERVIVLGDFNVAPEDRDVHDPALWQGSVLVSERERKALSAIFADGYVDVFRRFEQPEKSFSWWDYREGAFRRNHGLRIDLILANQAFAEQCKLATIDTQPRKWERPSDHTPVIAEFD